MLHLKKIGHYIQLRRKSVCNTIMAYWIFITLELNMTIYIAVINII